MKKVAMMMGLVAFCVAAKLGADTLRADTETTQVIEERTVIEERIGPVYSSARVVVNTPEGDRVIIGHEPRLVETRSFARRGRVRVPVETVVPVPAPTQTLVPGRAEVRSVEVDTDYTVSPRDPATGLTAGAVNGNEITGWRSVTDVAGVVTPQTASDLERDRVLTRQVQQAIEANQSLTLAARNVNVSITGGHLTLRGLVNTEEERAMIRNIARSVPGVISIDDFVRTVY
jgi:hypothetical protein